MSPRRALAWVALAPLMALCGCGVQQAVLEPSGPAARLLAGLGWFVLLLASAVSLVVIGLVVVGALRRRGTLAEHAPHDAGGGTRWVVIGGFAAPAAILAVVYLATLGTLGRFPLGGAGDQAALQVIGHQWWWELKYEVDGQQFTTANELHIPVGRTVEIALSSRDVIHSFWVPRLHGKVDLIPGQVNHIRLRADAAGVYRGECAEFCGEQHAHMAFLVVAEPSEAYEAWLARQLAPAAAAPEVRVGQQVFETHACVFCHTVRGEAPGGSVAPDLTHLASRRTIAAGTLANTPGNLAAWVVNAPSLKPGTQMPAMTQFSGEELRALVAYLESLE